MGEFGDAGGVRYDYTNVMAECVGPEHGLSEEEFSGLAAEVSRFHGEIVSEREAGKLPFMDLPKRSDYAEAVLEFAASERDRFENVVVLGIGGSALGTIALQSALNHPFYNMLSKDARGGPRLFVADNIDPVLIRGLLDVIEPEKTLFNVVTKSGQTAETMSQLMLVVGLLRERVGPKVREHVVATTDPAGGALRKIADAEGFRTFEVPDGVGGRFSVLSPVALLPAAMVGIDVKGLLAGAAAMDERLRSDQFAENPAYTAAAVHYLLDTKHGKSVAVIMSYSHQLRDVADWFKQLWAESLGKADSIDGRQVHVGQTPVKAVGVTDQHSQMQLYVEGPADKMFTLLATAESVENVDIPVQFVESDACAYLSGRTFGELFNAERRGTEIALTESGRPNATITLVRVEPQTVGGLLYMLELQTVMAGKLYRVNAFDQPGVEAGKVASYALMGRAGFEERRRQIERKLKAAPRRVL